MTKILESDFEPNLDAPHVKRFTHDFASMMILESAIRVNKKYPLSIEQLKMFNEIAEMVRKKGD